MAAISERITFSCTDCGRSLTVGPERAGKPFRCSSCYAKNVVPGGRRVEPKSSGRTYAGAIGSILVGVVLIGVAGAAFVKTGGRVVAYGPAAVGLGLALIGVLSAMTGVSLRDVNEFKF